LRLSPWPAGEVGFGRSNAMTRDPQVDLIFSHFIPRYEATGVDPNDLRAHAAHRPWSEWCVLRSVS
jgi:hypothetical protein